jgi:Tol biopolymer transport system component/tRNA A-37 threonylcarbamoyl transferase component Bud32
MTDVLDRLKSALSDRYAIERELGAGGMATVYLAVDLKHHRKVAVKVLRPDLAAALGPERFLQEIEIAAQLQHPNILALYDSGEADGFLYYVMPYIEGPSLRDKLAKEGELPIGDAVRILRDVVDALTHAHKHGVVHRDIKPDNVLLSERHALVTDFGVAKAVSEATRARKLTTEGVALGTPAYMSPEQAVADTHVDHRADIYAVGAVAYELLTGRAPFLGTTPQMILSAHIADTPEPVSKYRESVPPALEELVMKCLEKKAADRWQSAEELLPQLEVLATPSGGVTPTDMRPMAATPSRRRWLVPGVVAATLLVVIAVVLYKVMAPSPLIITTGNITQVTRDPGLEFQPAISPNGDEVEYVVGPIGNPRLMVRSSRDIASGGAIRPGEEVAGLHWLPQWTSSGASLRFYACQFAARELGSGCAWKEVGKLGGSVRTVSVPRVSSAYAWSPDGTRVAFAVEDSIFAYSVAGGNPELLGVQVVDPWSPHSLAWSPDGRRIAYVNGNAYWRNSANASDASIWVLDASGDEPVRVTDESTMNLSPQWLPDSRHLLFVSDRDGPRGIYVVEVGPDGPRGPARSVLASSDPHSISISADGRRLAYAKFLVTQNIWSISIPQSGVVSIHNAVPVTTGNQVIESHGLSPDGEWIAFDSDLQGEFDIYKQRLRGGSPELVADISGNAFDPDWSPDGSEIAFYTTVPLRGTGGMSDVLVVSADGGTPEQLTDFPGFDNNPAWSPDGLTIAYHSEGPTGSWPHSKIWTVSRDSIGGPWGDPVQLTDFYCRVPHWAPHGDAVVCEAYDDEIVVVSRGGDVLWRYPRSNAGLRSVQYPAFSWDGSRIYFTGTRGVWWIPADGGDATKVVAFDDPALTVPVGVTVGPEDFYLTIAEYESDIWVMDLEW